jgi:hypothetical protein
MTADLQPAPLPPMPEPPDATVNEVMSDIHPLLVEGAEHLAPTHPGWSHLLTMLHETIASFMGAPGK